LRLVLLLPLGQLPPLLRAPLLSLALLLLVLFLLAGLRRSILPAAALTI
jgi:hypothetical protein